MIARRASSGFTMIELMLALAIFALITTIMFGSFSQTASSKRVIQSEQERTHAVRVALMRMTREIEMAYWSDNENTAIANRRTLFVGSARVDVDELMFSTFAHQRLRAGAESGGVPVSASSPALLVSEVEVQKKAQSQETAPIVPAPAPAKKS